MIIRTYSCLNRYCRHEFDAEGDFPPCPRCRGLRVQWVPKPVAIRSASMKRIDTTARELAADFGLSNFQSPRFGEPAVKPAPQKTGENYFEPMKGWRINVPDAALAGQGHALCMPTGVTAKIKVDPNAGGLTENPNFGMGRMRAATQIEGTHRGRIR